MALPIEGFISRGSSGQAAADVPECGIAGIPSLVPARFVVAFNTK